MKVYGTVTKNALTVYGVQCALMCSVNNKSTATNNNDPHDNDHVDDRDDDDDGVKSNV